MAESGHFEAFLYGARKAVDPACSMIIQTTTKSHLRKLAHC